MKKSGRSLARVFAAVMLLFCLFLAWYVPTNARLDQRIDDLERSIESARGRERKQQKEYEEITARLPEAKAELEETQPLAEAAAAEVEALKAERKLLREEKQKLEEQKMNAAMGGAAGE